MIEKIEFKRHKLRGYDKGEDQLNFGACSYPFTPKNSYVDSSMDSIFEQRGEKQNTGGILHAIDSEVLLRKLLEKRRGDSSSNTNSNSNTSSKSQSLTKLNMVDELSPGGDMMNSQLSPSAPQVQFNPRTTEIPPPSDHSDK